VVEALQRRLPDASELVREHIEWALAEQRQKQNIDITHELTWG
jgi:hypothetical protein